MKKHIVLTILILSFGILVFGLTACSNEGGAIDDQSINAIEYDVSWIDLISMPEETGNSQGLENFNTLDLYGNIVDQSIFADYEITVVDVWGTYCNPCINAMPTLAKIHDEYQDQGVNVIGLIIDVQNGDFTPKKDYILKAMEITDMTGANFTHILLSENLLYSVVKDISAVPASFIVDNKGNLLSEIAYGGHSEEQWRELLDAYI